MTGRRTSAPPLRNLGRPQRTTTNGGGAYRATQRVSRPSAVPRATNCCATLRRAAELQRAVPGVRDDDRAARGQLPPGVADVRERILRVVCRRRRAAPARPRARVPSTRPAARPSASPSTRPPRAPASAAVRSARYVPRRRRRVRAGFHRAHGSLQTIDQNISCPVATPPVPALVHRDGERIPVAEGGAVGDPRDPGGAVGRPRQRLERSGRLRRADHDPVRPHGRAPQRRHHLERLAADARVRPARSGATSRSARGSSGASAPRSAPRARRSGRRGASRRRGSPCARARDAGRGDTARRSLRRRSRRRRPARSRARARRRRRPPSRARSCTARTSSSNRARHALT